MSGLSDLWIEDLWIEDTCERVVLGWQSDESVVGDKTSSHATGHSAGRAAPKQKSALMSRLLGLILAALRSAAPFYFRQPLRRPSAPFSLPYSQAFQHDDSLGDLIALDPKVRQHLVNIHFSSVP
jgi:hypothetical protein